MGQSILTRPVVPVPTKATAGVYVFKSISGHTVVGPTNIPQRSKTEKFVSEASKKLLRNHVTDLYPHTKGKALLGVYAGLRPATCQQDYVIDFDHANNWVTVGGIRYRASCS